MKAFVVAICVCLSLSICLCTPAAAGNCHAVSIVNSRVVVQAADVPHVNSVQSLVVPFAAQHVSKFNASAHALQSHVLQAVAVPVVANQAFVVQQNHCARVQQRAFVVEQRVRRERRGLARLLLGR